MNRSEKRLKATKSDVLRFYTSSQTFLNNFACMVKEIFRFFEIFRIPLKAASISSYYKLHHRRLLGHFSKGSKYAPTKQQWTSTFIFKILCSCGLGKLWVIYTEHLPKILIFLERPRPPKHFLRHPHLDTNDCLSYMQGNFFTSIARISFSFKTVNLFFYLLTTKLFLTSVLQISNYKYKFLLCLNKHVLNMI